MLEQVPSYITWIFILTVFTTIYLFYRASLNNNKMLLLILVWGGLVSFLALFFGFYSEWDATPPRMLILIGPPFLLIGYLLLSKFGKQFIGGFYLQLLTLVSIIRVPVEIVFLWLYQAGTIPELMTFHGVNFDILAGITAPIVTFVCFKRGVLSLPNILLLWNLVSIILLLNIVIHAILSAPTSFQVLAFEQPNIAIAYFPFVLLPAVVVPIVLFSMLASVRLILKEKKLNSAG